MLLKSGFQMLIALWIMVISWDLRAQQSVPDLTTVSVYPLWSPLQKATVHIQGMQKSTTLVLLSPECPMCINYIPLLKKLGKDYGHDLQIAGLIPGRTYEDSTVMQFMRTYEINFPVYVDRDMQVSRYLKGEVTPEVFLFNDGGKLVYHGAIDNWLSALGKKRTRVDQHYLLDAIEQMLKGNMVALSYVKPQGCLLNEY